MSNVADFMPALTMIDGAVTTGMPISDRACAYGHGLFETMLLCDSVVPLWMEHCQRMVSDSPVLGIHLEKQVLQSSLDNFIRGLDDPLRRSGIIKLIVTAGSGGRGYQSPANVSPRIVLQYFPLTDDIGPQRQMGVELTECCYRLPVNPILAGIKHLNRLDQVLARAEWDNHYDDGCMFSCDDLLIETTRANLFLKTADGWVTPRLDQSGVRGVMRGILLHKVFAECGLQVSETDVTRDLYQQVIELFICSSVRGVIPVTGTPTTGPLEIGTDTRKLQRVVETYCRCYQ